MLSKLSSKSSISICIRFISTVEALNEIYFSFNREVTHFDARIRNSIASGMKLKTFRYYMIASKKKHTNYS